MPFESELALLRAVAWQAGELALRYAREGFAAEDKPDDSPVTIADRECERLITSTLLEAYPDDGLLGEEGADKPASNGRRWIIDPIDGTRDFVRGNRLWSNLLALEVNGVVEVGTATFPALGEQYFAVRGEGAYCAADGKLTRLQASPIQEIGRAVGCYSDIGGVLRRPLADRVLPFLAQFWAVRSLGGAWDCTYVCSGKAEMWVEPRVKPWDVAALSLIAKESGCRYFDLTGVDTLYGQGAVVCTPALEPHVREFLGL